MHELTTYETTSRPRVRLARAAALVTLAGLALPALADDTEAIHDSGAPAALHENWMSWLPDDVSLAQLSIPLAHDAATTFCGGDAFEHAYCRTQTMGLGAQLRSGIRGLDIRIRYRDQDTIDTSDDDFTLHHGSVDLNDPNTGDNLTLDYALGTTCGFLEAHGQETVIMNLGDGGQEARHDGIDEDDANVLHNKILALLDVYIADYRSCIWLPGDDPSYSDLIPTLGMVRGKIVIVPSGPGPNGILSNGTLSRFGPWANHVSAGGDARFVTAASLGNHTEALVDNIHLADNYPGSDIFHFTQLNAHTHATPFHLAAGLDGIIGATPQGTNERMVEWLLGLREIDGDSGLSVDNLGIVGFDFPGASIIEAVIAHNFRLVDDVADLDGFVEDAVNSWAHHVENEVDNRALLREHAMRDFLVHVLPDWTTLHTLMIKDGGFAVRAQNNGLSVSSGEVHDYTFRAWTSDGDPSSVDFSALQALLNSLVASLENEGNEGVRRSWIGDRLAATFPLRRVTVVVKPRPVGPHDLWYTNVGTLARSDDDDFAHVVWLYDGPAPPVADAGGPYVDDEGSTITLDASGSSDPQGLSLQYRWDTDNDTVWDTARSSSATTTITREDKYKGTVRLEVWNGIDAKTDTASVTFTNVAPSLSLSTADIDENDVATVTGTITDPGILDDFTVQVYWGDSNDAAASPEEVTVPVGQRTFSVTHQYLDDGPAPGNGQGVDTYAIEADIADDDGGTGRASTGINVSNVAPSLSLFTTGVDENGVATLMATITDPGTLDEFTVTIDWGDPNDSSLDFYSLPAGLRTFTADHRYLDDGPAPGNGTASDTYRIRAEIVDDDGGRSDPVATTTITVANVAPSLSLSTTGVDENSVATLMGTITDPGTLDVHTVTIDWDDPNDSTPTVVNVPLGARSFTETHRYLDDGPAPGNGTPQDTHTITAALTDDDAGALSQPASASITVRNVAPTLSLATSDIDENGVATLTGTLVDPGTLDVHTLTIDWDDPNDSTPTFVNVPVGARSFTETHRYLDDGPAPGNGTPQDTHAITAALMDDDTGALSQPASAIIEVSNVDPVASFDTIIDSAGNLIGPVPPNAHDVVLQGLEVSVSVIFSDVGSLDGHMSTIDWDDGSFDPGQTTSPVTGTHVYQELGTQWIAVTVVDDDTGVVMVSRDIEVVDAAGAIEDLVEDLQELTDDPATDPEVVALVEEAIDELVGHPNDEGGGGALDLIDEKAWNAVLVKLRKAAALLEEAGLTTATSHTVLTAKSIIVLLTDAAEAEAASERDLRAVAKARELIAAGDAETSGPLAIQRYREALIALRAAMVM